MGNATGLPYPSPTDNGLHLYPIDLGETIGPAYRGRMPGIYTPLESTTGVFASNDRTIIINNKNYLAIKLMAYATGVGNCFMDITGPW